MDRYNDSSFFNHATRILAVSRFSANFVNDKLGIKRKIDVIYNPLNLKGLLKMAEAISKGGERTKNIVFLGKVVETKGEVHGKTGAAGSGNIYRLSTERNSLQVLEKCYFLCSPLIFRKFQYGGFGNYGIR